jgi:tetratricopeptide (TPR) repeat protein
MRSENLAAALLCAALLACCGGPPAEEKKNAPTAAPAAKTRPAFSAPDLPTVDAAVREQIAAARRQVEAKTPAGGPASAASWLRLGQLYHAYDLLEPAAAAYENALFDLPGDRRIEHFLGLVRQRQGRLEEAARFFRGPDGPRSAAAAYRLGQVENSAGRPAEAKKALEAARAFDRNCVAAVYELGLLAAQEGKPEEAATLFEAVLAAQPSALQAHFPLGQALQRLGRAEEAKKHLAASAAREVSVGGRATCDDPIEAELRPLTTGAAAYITRGQAARFAGRNAEALAEFRQAVAIAPNDPVAHQALGRMLAGQGDLEGALAEYRRATELDPAAAELKVDLGLLLEQKGEGAAAGKLFREALARNPDLPAAHFGLARLALAAGEAEPALASLGRVLALEPANAPARGLRAELLMELKRPAEALADVRHLLDESPPADPLEHASLAWAAAALGDRERAFVHLEQVAAQKDAPPRAKAAARYRLASLHQQGGDLAAARAELEAALALEPGLEPARQMLERLR